MKRLLAAVFALLMLFVCLSGPVLASGTDSRLADYSDAITALQTYLEGKQADTLTLADIKARFDRLEMYDYSYLFKYYTSVLLMIENGEDASTLELYLEMLYQSTDFNEYLRILASSIRPVEELTAYARGRSQEAAGNAAQACACYMQCMSFFDAPERYLALQGNDPEIVYNQAIAAFEARQFNAAYALFHLIGDYKDSAYFTEFIVRQMESFPDQQPTETVVAVAAVPTPAPVSVSTEAPDVPANAAPAEIAASFRIINCNIGEGYNILYWEQVDGAVRYTLYQRTGDGQEREIYSGPETSGFDGTVTFGRAYYYYVVAALGQGGTVRSEEMRVVSASASANTSQSSPAPTMSFLPGRPTGIPHVIVRTPPPGVIVSTPEPTVIPVADTGTNNSPTSSTLPPANAGTQDPDSIDATPDPDASLTEPTAEPHYILTSTFPPGIVGDWSLTVIYYRYRDTYVGYSDWSVWSDWSNVYVMIDNPDLIQQESMYDEETQKTLYRHRTRETVPMFTDWSEWSKEKPESKDGREIEQKTVY